MFGGRFASGSTAVAFAVVAAAVVAVVGVGSGFGSGDFEQPIAAKDITEEVMRTARQVRVICALVYAPAPKPDR
jgi:hypothetical protein